jgi:hypothetical protein
MLVFVHLLFILCKVNKRFAPGVSCERSQDRVGRVRPERVAGHVCDEVEDEQPAKESTRTVSEFSIQIQNPTICQDRLSHYSPVLWDRICESLDEKAQRGLIAGAAL